MTKENAILDQEEELNEYFTESFDFDELEKELQSQLEEELSNLEFLKEVVYISCNPSTFARDVKLFSEKGYVLKKLQAVDMFPQTSHIECVGLIVKE